MQLNRRGAALTLYSLLHRFQSRFARGRYGIQTEATIELAELNIYNEECRRRAADISTFARSSA